MIRINLSILMALILMALPFRTSAQSPEEIESQMDIIKLDESMIYGEDYNDDMEMAYGNALEELLITTNEMRAEKGLEPLMASDVQPAVKELRYAKGERHVVMVYMPVDRMMSLKGGFRSDAIIQGLILTPAAVQSTVSTFLQRSPPPATSNFESDEMLEVLCDQDNWVEIKGFLSSFKSQGKIKMTGAVTTAAEVPEDACSILIDDMGGILAILSPKNSTSRINYRTNQSDNETNHSNCKFIVWYK